MTKSRKAREKEEYERWEKQIAADRELNDSKEDKIERARRLPSWKATDEEKSLLALSMIPAGARRLLSGDLAEFKGSFIAGWLCDSQYVCYGICDGKNHNGALSIPHYSLCISWEPTIEETLRYLGNSTLARDYKSKGNNG